MMFARVEQSDSMVNLADATDETWNKDASGLGGKQLNGNVSCEDLEKMTAKDVRGLKRAR